MSIGEKIKKYRKEKNITQAELASMIGKSKSSIEKYEAGKVIPSVMTAKTIAKILDIEISDLVDLSEPIDKQLNIEQTGIENISLYLGIDYNGLSAEGKNQINEIYKINKKINDLIEKGEIHLYEKDSSEVEKLYQVYLKQVRKGYEIELNSKNETIELLTKLMESTNKKIDKLMKSVIEQLEQKNKH